MAPRRVDRSAPAVADNGYRTKSDIARQHIEELILSGRVRAGNHVTTREVSEALGMSETPVREAMRSLAAQGWLDLRAHLGGVVALSNSEQLEEIYAMRGALGAVAIELGGPHYTPQQLDALNRNLTEAAEAAASGDVPRFARLNRQFHALLADTPNTQRVLQMINGIASQTAAMARGFEVIPGRIERACHEHQGIMAAIAGGDYQRAAALLVEHERRAGAELIAALGAARRSNGAG